MVVVAEECLNSGADNREEPEHRQAGPQAASQICALALPPSHPVGETGQQEQVVEHKVPPQPKPPQPQPPP